MSQFYSIGFIFVASFGNWTHIPSDHSWRTELNLGMWKWIENTHDNKTRKRNYEGCICNGLEVQGRVCNWASIQPISVKTEIGQQIFPSHYKLVKF